MRMIAQIKCKSVEKCYENFSIVKAMSHDQQKTSMKSAS